MIVVPVMPPVAATEITLDETDSAAVTGQMVVASCTTSVTSTVDTCSGAVEARSERDDESAGQLVTVGAQLMTVRTWVDSTVRVVSCSAAGVGTVPLAMGAGGAPWALDATPVGEGPAAAEVMGTTVAVTVSSISGSQVSSSSSGRVAFAGPPRAAPTAAREKSRSEASAPADWKRMMGGRFLVDQRSVRVERIKRRQQPVYPIKGLSECVEKEGSGRASTGRKNGQPAGFVGEAKEKARRRHCRPRWTAWARWLGEGGGASLPL